jgi:hypothetical protein
MEKLNRWLSLFANIGIVAGLVLVTLQLQQGYTMAQVNLTDRAYSRGLENIGYRVAEELPTAWARAAANAPDLSDSELLVIDSYLQREWASNIANSKMSNVLGGPILGGEVQSSAPVGKWAYTLLGNEVALRWWQFRHDALLAKYPELRDAVDAELAGSDIDHRTYHKELISELRAGKIYTPTL